jgi:hypothetical protein
LLLRFSWFVYLIAAALLLGPSLVLGTLVSQSAPQNLAWAAQFSEQFRAGILYPRWMPDSFDGLGGGAFYFYPPLPFWLDAVVSLCTFGGLSASSRLPLDWVLLLWASGLAMHAWLATETRQPRVAFWGGLAYMASPYHLFVDHYMRGAFAESTAYVFLPLAMLGIRRAADQRPTLILLAVSYCALLMSHLPTALLASVTLIPAYAVFRARTLREVGSVVAGGCLGAGLAAIYLLPAMLLQGWISADQFWTRFYRVDNWFLLVPARWPEPLIMQTIASMAAAALVLAAAVCIFSWKRVDARFWAIACIVCIALLAGLLPWFWQLPEIAKVQFPWRLMLAVEFAVVSALCLARFRPLGRSKIYVFVASLLVALPGVSFGLAAIGGAVEQALRGEIVQAQDVKEYEPHGYPLTASPAYAQLGLEPLADRPPATCLPAARMCRAEAGRFGTMLVEIDSDVATDVVLRRFFFPSWRLDPAASLMPSVPFRLLSFTAPPGRHTYHLERTVLPVEQWGWAISGVSMILLLAAAARTSGARPGNPSAQRRFDVPEDQH